MARLHRLNSLRLIKMSMLQSMKLRCNDQTNSAAASGELSQLGDEICLKGVTPNVSIAGPVPKPPGFPLKARGNDGQ
jgi:hypothetical protein